MRNELRACVACSAEKEKKNAGASYVQATRHLQADLPPRYHLIAPVAPHTLFRIPRFCSSSSITDHLASDTAATTTNSNTANELFCTYPLDETLADPRLRNSLSGVPGSTTASFALPLPAPRQPPSVVR